MMIVIEPRREPFPLDVVSGFWDGEDDRVSAFSTGIDSRDSGLCIVGGCGYDIGAGLDHCHIVPQADADEWNTLQETGYIPRTKRTGKTYPRNGILLCKSHHALFDAFFFFIRYVQETQQYYFVNCSAKNGLDRFDGLPCILNPQSKYAPHPNLFLNHEGYSRHKWKKFGLVYRFPNPTPSAPGMIQSLITAPPGLSPTSLTTFADPPPGGVLETSPMAYDLVLAYDRLPCAPDHSNRQHCSIFGLWETESVKELVKNYMNENPSSDGISDTCLTENGFEIHEGELWPKEKRAMISDWLDDVAEYAPVTRTVVSIE